MTWFGVPNGFGLNTLAGGQAPRTKVVIEYNGYTLQLVSIPSLVGRLLGPNTPQKGFRWVVSLNTLAGGQAPRTFWCGS